LVFSSITFLLFFLPAALLLYFGLPKKWQNPVLLLISIAFYAWGAPKFVFILLLSTYIDYHLVNALHRSTKDRRRRSWLSLSILLNLGLLFYFKYTGFFVESISAMLRNWGILPEAIHLKILLPIGISFYTFQTLTYSIDVYRRKVKPLEKATDYLLYIFLFPQMIAGPIVRFSSIAREIRERSRKSVNLFVGFERFALGLAKKVLIANPCGGIADRFIDGNLSELSGPQAWIGIIAYTMQIYFDFSGYSDMAIGLGRMLGFHFPENFNHPYTSKSITEFWRRWHITLGAWMRDYLYIPLGGNQKGPRRTYFNLWVVFLASGLWHGAAWNFVLWGALHGLLLVIERLFKHHSWALRIPNFIKLPSTFFLVMMAWVLFRIEDFSRIGDYYQLLFSGSWLNLNLGLKNFESVHLSMAILLSFLPLVPGLRLKSGRESFPALLGRSVLSLAFVILSLSWISSSGFNPFIYFRF
jgi:alginate O-acetyltransferase complex protein AlgI